MFIDSHCHLDRLATYQPISQSTLEAKKVGVTHFINPATTATSWSTLLELPHQHPDVSIALGLHPCFITEHRENHLEQLEVNVREHSVRLIGEIGLDKRFLEHFPQQMQCFTAQLALAKHLKRPVIIHSVRAHHEILQQLKSTQFTQGGIVHAFYGSVEQAKAYTHLGFKLGIGSLITYPKNKKLQQVVKRLPLSSFVLETDSPDMSIVDQALPYSTPSGVPLIFQHFQRFRSEPTEQIVQQLWDNSIDFCDL